jgi:SAM-dependent methyltransferase
MRRSATLPTYTSLPQEVSQEMKRGDVLVGDDFNSEQLALWFSQEQEAYFEGEAGTSEEDPWYAYMRYVNEILGFSVITQQDAPPESMLVLGPASGKEVGKFALENPGCTLSFVEASLNFQHQLRERFPGSTIIAPHFDGHIDLPSQSQDVALAFSVLHHIPNVSMVLSEMARVTRPKGLVLVREPCSSMGDWRFPRSATPNERGISRHLLIEIAIRAGLRQERQPVPILLEPINKLLKRTVGFAPIPFATLYRVDRLLSWALSFNDHYWRDSWLKKVGPSSYFYVFRRAEQC